MRSVVPLLGVHHPVVATVRTNACRVRRRGASGASLRVACAAEVGCGVWCRRLQGGRRSWCEAEHCPSRSLSQVGNFSRRPAKRGGGATPVAQLPTCGESRAGDVRQHPMKSSIANFSLRRRRAGRTAMPCARVGTCGTDEAKTRRVGEHAATSPTSGKAGVGTSGSGFSRGTGGRNLGTRGSPRSAVGPRVSSTRSGERAPLK